MRRLAAGGMRESVTGAAWEEMVSATEAVGGDGTEKVRSEAGGGGGAPRGPGTSL